MCVQVKSEKPEPILGVICATLCIAEGAFKKRFADYQVLLERGQVMNAELLSNVVDVELIYSGVKYTLKASRVQPTSESTPHTIPPHSLPPTPHTPYTPYPHTSHTPHPTSHTPPHTSYSVWAGHEWQSPGGGSTLSE